MNPVRPLPEGALVREGQYSIAAPLDLNGFVLTYRAHRTDDGEAVLLKEFCRLSPTDGRSEDGALPNKAKMSAQRLRFLFEQSLLQGQDPYPLPGVVRMLDRFSEGNSLFTVLAHVPGELMQGHLDGRENGALPPLEAVRTVVQLVRALAEWEEVRSAYLPPEIVLQVNLHPGSVLRQPGGQPVLLHVGSDFPVPGYVAPERLAPGGRATTATPVYAFGALLYRLLTGNQPPETAGRCPVDKWPGLLLNPGFPEGLAPVVIKSIQTNGANRYPNMGEMAEALGRFVEKPEAARFTETVNGVSFEMILVRGGTFVPGHGGLGEKTASNGSGSTSPVTLDDFFIGETVVTVALWRAVMQPAEEVVTAADCPVEGVNWYEAQRFVRRLSYETGRAYRLPTEAEWEYAAQGGPDAQRYAFAGSEELDEVGWYRNNSEGFLRPVKQKKPNSLGLFDMSGNVWEWCEDWYAPYPTFPRHNPRGPENGTHRVARGGCYFDRALLCQISERRSDYPGARYGCPGLRLALGRRG